MGCGIDQPEHWHNRANEVRELANLSDPKLREELLAVAADYENIARRAEQRVKGYSAA